MCIKTIISAIYKKRYLIFVCFWFILIFYALYGSAFKQGFDLGPFDLLSHNSSSPPKNILLIDAATQFIPWDTVTRETLCQFKIPFWNSYNACGEPFLANYQSSIFYPPSLVTMFLPHPYAFKTLLKLLICFVGMFIFLAEFGIMREAAFVGCFCFTFSGYNTVWLVHPHSNVSVWMPFLFYFWTKFVHTNNPKILFGLIGVIFIQMLGGHPETHLFTAVCLFLFALFYKSKNQISLRMHFFRVLFLLPFLHIFGLFLAGFQIVPFLEYLQLSTAKILKVYYQNSNLENYHNQIKQGEAFWALLFPKLFGSPINESYKGPANFNEINGGFTGLISIYLSCFLTSSDKRYYLPFFMILVFSLFVVYENPLSKILLHPYPLNILPYSRFLLGIAFSVSCLAALGMKSIIQNSEADRKFSFSTSLYFLIIIFALFIFFPAEFSNKENVFYQTLCPLLLTILTLQFFKGKLRIGGIVFFLSLELFLFSSKYIPSTDKEKIYNVLPNLLQKDTQLFRFTSLMKTIGLPNNTNLMFKIYSPTSYDAMGVENYFNFLRVTSPFDIIYPDPLFNFPEKPNHKLFDFLNIKYLSSSADLGKGYEETVELFFGKEKLGSIYKNTDCLERAFLVDHILGCEEDKTTLSILSQPDFPFDKKVILNIQENYQFQKSSKKEECIIEQYSNELIKIKVDIDQPRCLVLSEVYYPGWEAWMDGTRVSIYRANYAFRGLILNKPGKHEIILKFFPKTFYWGCLLSLIFFILLIFSFMMFHKNQHFNSYPYIFFIH